MKHLLIYFACFMLYAAAAPTRGNGLTGILPVWDGSEPTDGIGIRFQFYVADNDSEGLKLIFADSRLRGPQPDTYLLEYNIYSSGLLYDDWIYTTWPMQGTYTQKQASLRVAVPDYIGAGKTGVKTFDPTMFPRQTYEIDGIEGLWKTDLITQTDMNQIMGSVLMTRGDIITDLSGWRADGSYLPTDTYRQWNVSVDFGKQSYNMAFAFPNANAQWLASWEPLTFFSEFLHEDGLFRVNYWDFGIMREGTGEWEPINKWRVSHHDGSLNDFGVIRSLLAGTPVIEFSNDPSSTYLPVDSIIDITPVPEPSTLILIATGFAGLIWRQIRMKNVYDSRFPQHDRSRNSSGISWLFMNSDPAPRLAGVGMAVPGSGHTAVEGEQSPCPVVDSRRGRKAVVRASISHKRPGRLRPG